MGKKRCWTNLELRCGFDKHRLGWKERELRVYGFVTETTAEEVTQKAEEVERIKVQQNVKRMTIICCRPGCPMIVFIRQKNSSKKRMIN
jgi:hypothetical protein